MKDPNNSIQSEPEEDAVNCLGNLLRSMTWSWYAEGDETTGANEEIMRLTSEYPEIFARTYQVSMSENTSYPITLLCDSSRDIALETIVAAYEAYPPALRIPDRMGDLPIHRACTSEFSVDVVRFLHQQHPDSALTRGAFGRTPLHLACGAKQTEPVRKVIHYLVDACPKAALEPSSNGDLPLHTVLRSVGRPSLHRAETLSDLLRVAPTTASAKDCFRETPLKLLLADCTFQNDTKLELAKEMLAAYPEAAMEVVEAHCLWGANSWDIQQVVLGYHLWQTKGKSKDYASRYPLHAILHVYNLSNNSFFLIDAIYKFRRHLKQLDEDDNLPLHIALQRSAQKDGLPITAIHELLALGPRAALVRDSATGLYPFMTIARRVRSHEQEAFSAEWRDLQWLDLAYRCLRVEPHRFLSGVGAGQTDPGLPLGMTL